MLLRVVVRGPSYTINIKHYADDLNVRLNQKLPESKPFMPALSLIPNFEKHDKLFKEVV